MTAQDWPSASAWRTITAEGRGKRDAVTRDRSVDCAGPADPLHALGIQPHAARGQEAAHPQEHEEESTVALGCRRRSLLFLVLKPRCADCPREQALAGALRDRVASVLVIRLGWQPGLGSDLTKGTYAGSGPNRRDRLRGRLSKLMSAWTASGVSGADRGAGAPRSGGAYRIGRIPDRAR